jgi:hypothetical protein
VPEFTVELAVGDVLIIGNRTLTVIDIEGSEVHFRVDPHPHAPGALASFSDADSPTFRTKAK